MSVLTVMRARYPRLLRSDFLQHGALVLAGTMTANVLAYLFNVLASRALGVEAFGALTSLVALSAIAGLPASVAMTVAAKYAAELRATGNHETITGLVERSVALSGGIAVVLFLLGSAFSGPLAHFLHMNSNLPVVAIAALIALGFPLAAMRGLITGIQSYGAFTLTIVVEAVLKCGGIALVYAGMGVLGAVGGFIAGAVAALAIALYALRGHLSGARRPLRIDVPRLVQATLGVACGMAGITLLSSMDMLLAKHFLPATPAGYYAVVAQAGKMLFFLGSFVPALVVPKASARAASGSPAFVVLRNACLAAGLLLAAGLCVFLVAPRFIVTLLGGGAFAPAAPYVFPYGLAISAVVLLQIVIYYKISIHRFDFIVPLVAGAAAQAAGIAHWHANIAQIVDVLCIVNFATLAGASLAVRPSKPEPVR